MKTHSEERVFKMKYKLIAVDMDGTLLNSKGEITETTAEAIRMAVEKGIIFTISTGRPIQGVEKYNSLLHLKGPVITYNGAMIVNAESHEILFRQELVRSDAKQIWEMGLQYDTTMCIWSNNRLYSNKWNDKIHDYKKLSGVEPILLKDFETLPDMGITKILWYDEVERIEDFMRVLSPDMFSEVSYCTSKPTFLEFFSSKVSKSVAMKKIGEIYNITRDEMVAIGDGLNDLSMIQYAGLGVAMGNAEEEVKRNSQFVTTTNDEDGVRLVIEKLI